MTDEVWTMRDGQHISVGKMTEEHAKNALRMILRNRRKEKERVEQLGYPDHAIEDHELTVGESQELMNAEARSHLADPNVYFPLLGVYGSPELARQRGGKV